MCLPIDLIRAYWARYAIPVFILSISAPIGRAQGTVVFHNTGGGQQLISEVRSLFIDASLSQPHVVFDFGFATDETPGPGAFLDSFTVTMQSTNQQFTAVYLTADATGVAWAPPTPGGLPLDPAAITAKNIPYPSLQPVLATKSSYEVSAPIPSQFLGASVNVFFDLFDNLDNRTSQGWFNNLNVVSVPEPGVLSLVLAGTAILLRFNRCPK